MAEERKSGLSRRELVLSSVAGAGALALGVAGSRPAAAQSQKPIKLGYINSLTGSVSSQAEANLNGLKLYFDSINWTAGGRKIELLVEDDQFNPQAGLQKAKKLVESDEVDMVCGVQASNVALALVNYLKSKNMLFVITGAGSSQLTADPYPLLFRTSLSSVQLGQPMAEWGYENLGKEAITVGSDYAGGRDTIADFKAPYLAKGGKLIKEIYPPLGSMDFSPYLLEVRSAAPPLVYCFMPGVEIVRFVQQFIDMGLMQKTALSGFALADSGTINALGKKALGVYTSTIFTDTLDTPEAKAFITAYHDRYKAFPDLYAEYGFAGAHALAEALKTTGGDVADKSKFAQALLAVDFKAPRGRFRFDQATHNPIQDVYICRLAEMPDGRVDNKVISTVKDVRDPGKKKG